MNIIVDITYLISGIYTNFWIFLCKKCDCQSSNETDDYLLVFIVSISLLRRILNACQKLNA